MITRSEFIKQCSKYTIGSAFLTTMPLILRASFLPKLNEELPMENNAVINSSINSYQIVDEDENSILILAYEFDVSSSISIPTNKNLIVFSYRTIIQKDIRLEGTNFFLFTNKLICNNNPTINVTGNNGRPFSEPAASPSGGCNTSTNNPKANNADNKNSRSIQEDDKKGGTMNGQDSGDVFLNLLTFEGNFSIKAQGGNGGKGEKGQDGKNGCDVVKDNMQYDKNVENDRGVNFIYTGFPGEDGGDGALGGYGGKGGNVIFTLPQSVIKAINKRPQDDNHHFICNVDSNNNSSIYVDMSAGIQGDSGDGGAGKNGGAGITFNWYWNKLDQNGRVGKTGNPGKSPSNSFGRSGDIQAIDFNISIYNKYVVVEFVQLLLLKAESFYLNSSPKKNLNETDKDDNLKQAYEIFKFIAEITKSNSVGSGYDEPANSSEITKYLSYLNGYRKKVEEWSFVISKCNSYISQIGLGQDIFGNPFNYTPTLEAEFLLEINAPIIQNVKDFEEYVQGIINKKEDIKISIDKNQSLIDQNRDNIQIYESEISSYSDSINLLNKELGERFAVIEQLKNNLLSEDDAFRNAVENESKGCTLANMLHFATAVVSVVSAIYTMGASAIIAVGSVGNVISKLDKLNDIEMLKTALGSDGIITEGIKDISNFDNDISRADDNLKKLKEAYKTISESDKSTPPKTLFRIKKEDFDKMIERFLNLDEAKKYKEDYHYFIDYIELTNQKRIQITTYLMAINNCYQNKELAEKKIKELNNSIFKNQITDISAYDEQAIINLFYQVKYNIIKIVYLQKKALNYEFPKLQNYSADNYNDTNLHTLQTNLLSINTTLLSRLNNSTFQQGYNTNTPWSLRKTDKKKVFPFNNFLNYTDSVGYKVHAIEFKIQTYDLSNPSNKVKIANLNKIFGRSSTNLKVMGAKAIFNCNNNLTKDITYQLLHLGNSTLTIDCDFQTPINFSHRPLSTPRLTTTINKKFDGFSDDEKINMVGTTLSGKKCRVGAGIFASWKLIIRENDNNLSSPEIEEIIANLDSIDFYFWYYYDNKAECSL